MSDTDAFLSQKRDERDAEIERKEEHAEEKLEKEKELIEHNIEEQESEMDRGIFNLLVIVLGAGLILGAIILWFTNDFTMQNSTWGLLILGILFLTFGLLWRRIMKWRNKRARAKLAEEEKAIREKWDDT